MSNSSFIISHFLFFQTSLLTCSLHSLNQSATLLTSPSFGRGSCSLIRQRGVRSTQLRLLLWSTHFMFPVLASPFVFSAVRAPSLPPTPPPSLRRMCWRFGHSAPLCKEEAQAGPICTLLHHPSTHRCANQSCLKGGFVKSVVGCCNASPTLCVNCCGQHTSFDGTCPVFREILSSLRPPRDQDIPDAPAPDPGLLQTTPQGPTAPPTVPATPARHGPRFPPSSESTHPETVKLVGSAAAHPTRAAPLPRRNLYGAGSTLFRASTGADWSEPAPTDHNMEL